MSENKNPLKKISYNSPVILTYALVCLIALVINFITRGWLNKTLLVARPHASLVNPLTYLRSVLYIFGHSDLKHFTSNMMLFLLVGPVAEERYGSQNLILMIGTTAIITAVINGLFFSYGIIGASGIVFMLIILSSFANAEKGKIPLSLILVAICYLGTEVFNGIFAKDNISQFAHIAGGVMGIIWGLIMQNRKVSV